MCVIAQGSIEARQFYEASQILSTQVLQFQYIFKQPKRSNIMDGKILEHQQTAGVIKLVFGSMLTMMPALSYGCLQSYFTIGVPKLMKPNQTGILPPRSSAEK